MNDRELLQNGTQKLNVDLSSEQVNSIFLFLAELAKWNRQINLTAIRNGRDVIVKHVLDSLSYLMGFDAVSGLRLLDMGSGAGFPAIPIKIAHPEIAVTLVESVKKKASFLRHVIRTVNLKGIEVLDKRTEQLPPTCHAAYDVVTARAFANMSLALTRGAPFLKPGGQAVLSRGPEEIIGDKDLLRAGFLLKKRVELLLPFSEFKRAIWVLERTV